MSDSVAQGHSSRTRGPMWTCDLSVSNWPPCITVCREWSVVCAGPPSPNHFNRLTAANPGRCAVTWGVCWPYSALLQGACSLQPFSAKKKKNKAFIYHLYASIHWSFTDPKFHFLAHFTSSTYCLVQYSVFPAAAAAVFIETSSDKTHCTVPAQQQTADRQVESSWWT